ncbi:MAG TPA: hypothetical protein VGG06_00600 [Thermoanaerobaculia bacterium]
MPPAGRRPVLFRNLRLAAVDESGAIHPTVLGLLLFSSEPDRFLTGAYVDVAVYDGPEPDADRLRQSSTTRGGCATPPGRCLLHSC